MQIRGAFLCTVLFLAPQLKVQAASADPCLGTESQAQNNWLLTINQGDAASRENLLESLRLLATGGFGLKQVFDLKKPELVFAATFDPSYWSTVEIAKKTKEDALRALIAIPGNRLECDAIVKIDPIATLPEGE